MRIARLRRILPVVALIAGLMAMALSCGGAERAEALRLPQPQPLRSRWHQAGPTGANAAAEGRRPPQAASEARVQKESAPAQPQGPRRRRPAPRPIHQATSRNVARLSGRRDRRRCESSSLQAQSGRQLIVEAWVSLEVHEIDAMVRQVEAVATQRGGWIESADIVGEAGYRTLRTSTCGCRRMTVRRRDADPARRWGA